MQERPRADRDSGPSGRRLGGAWRSDLFDHTDEVDDVDEDEDGDDGSDVSFPPHAIATTDEVANAASNRRRSATEGLPIPW